jgi:thioredoxin-related protein
MRKLLLWSCFALLALDVAAATQTPAGRMSGGQVHAMPDWFKQSFLNFKDEINELRQSGRHLLVFLDLNECPYCARLLDENFHHGENKPYLQKNFDVIALNIRGDSELTWIDGATYTEQELAAKLKFFGTPGLIFIDVDGKIVLQLNGYRSPQSLRHALEFVNTRAYRTQSLTAYVENKKPSAVYTFRDHPRFENATNLANSSKPLAILFEDKYCTDCGALHDKVLNRPDVLAELQAFRVVRLDAYADTPMVDPSGARTTPRAWAASLGLLTRPGVVLFDNGKEVGRIESRWFHFHFKEMLRYVGGRHYQRYDRFSAYLNDRQAELLKQGVHIDFAE